MILEGEEAIANYRKLMGATNYKVLKRERSGRDFCHGYENNVVHGSDSPETAAF